MSSVVAASVLVAATAVSGIVPTVAVVVWRLVPVVGRGVTAWGRNG